MQATQTSQPRKAMGTVHLVAASILAGAVLFGLAGTLRWWQAWLFLVTYVATIAALMGLVFNASPDLVAERARAAKLAPGWDRFLVTVMNLCLPSMLVLAALDHRFAWTPAVAPLWGILALGPMLGGNALTLLAMRSNRFFSSHVRIQEDRGHVVVSQGPYHWVRHPGYAGSLLFNLSVPILLGSWVAGGLGLLFLIVCLVRTALEDATLQRDLAGYRAYAEQVRFRLVPFVW